MIRPTKAGGAFLGLMVLLYLGALQSETGLLYFVLGILGGCFVLNAFGARRSVRGVSLELPHSIGTFEGLRLSEAWIVHNATQRELGLVEILGPWGPLLRVGLLAPGEQAAKTPEHVLERRGVYPFAELTARSAYPFGLLEARHRLAVEGQLVVYPAVYPCEAPQAAGFEPMVGGHYTGGHKSRSGTQFTGVRTYQADDPLRAIHWKSSARGQGLMVKEFEEELSGRVSILLDASSGAAPRGGSLLDWAARASASLLFAALDRGHHVEFVDLVRLERLTVPPFSDGTPVLESLAALPAEPGCLTRERLERALALVSHKSSLCLVLCRPGPVAADFLHSAGVARRKVSVYVPDLQASREALGDPGKASVFVYDEGALHRER